MSSIMMSLAPGLLFLIFILQGNGVQALKMNSLTPPMGWMTWTRFTCQIDCYRWPKDCVDATLIRETADRIKADGYSDAGYKYVNIDDCWSEMQRYPLNDRLIPDVLRFGGYDGIKNLSQYVHDQGLLLGIYGDCGTKTCAGYPAQLKSEHDYEDNYFDLDAQTLDEWAIDSFKLDGCNIDPSRAESICPKMTDAISNISRKVLITCEWPLYLLRDNPRANVNWNLATKSCNLIRYFDDVQDAWLSILSIIDFTVKMQKDILQHHGPGHWFDPDQLLIGNFGLSQLQAQAQMAIWSIWSAPLIMSNDLRNIGAEMSEILKNLHLITVDQDPLGIFGQMVAGHTNNWNSSVQAFVKPMLPIVDGCPSFAIVYLNRETLGGGNEISFNLRDLLLKSPIEHAAKRYQKLKPEERELRGKFGAQQCREKLAKAMTVDRNQTPDILEKPAGQEKEVTLENRIVTYNVLDLIGERFLRKLDLNQDLTLKVYPSAVRAVFLTEARELSFAGISYDFKKNQQVQFQ